MKPLRKIHAFFNKNEETIYFILLLCIAFSFSFSRYYLRMWEIMLVGLFVVAGNYNKKFSRLKENWPLLILSSFFLIHVLGLIYAEEITPGLKYLRVIMPWLGLPIIIGSYPKLSSHRFYIFLQVFVLGVFLHTLLSYMAYLGLPISQVKNYRELSLFISTHRFALTIVLAIFFLFYFIKEKQAGITILQIGGYVLVLFWLVYFLIFSKILTGILVFLVIAMGYSIYLLLSRRNIFTRFASLILVLFLLFFTGQQIHSIYKDFWSVPEIKESQLPETTVNGNPYEHNSDSKKLENGHYVDLYVCERELREEWNKRSNKNYNSNIGYYGKLSIVIKRYLTSKGLPKDSLGVSKLTNSDIKAIENGVINYRFQKFGFTDRLYRVAKDIYRYQIEGEPAGPFTARLYSINQAINIIKKQPVIGYGTNSLNPVFDKHYEKLGEQHKYHVPSHNQYLRYLLEFGVIGLIWFFLSVFYPYFKVKAYRNFLFNGMFAYFLLASTMNNTFNAQLALTIWVTFYSVFFVYFNKASSEKNV